MRLTNLRKEYGKLGNPKCRAGAPFDGCSASEAGARFLIDPDDCAEPRRSLEFQVFSVMAGVSLAAPTKAACMLMSSTPSAYPQVVSRCFALFRGLKFRVSAGHPVLCAWFDSRQLHWSNSRSGHIFVLACFLCKHIMDTSRNEVVHFVGHVVKVIRE
jgi:hypothetical protein